MNRYFVFKKVRSVDAKKVAEIVTKNVLETEEAIGTLMSNPAQEQEQEPQLEPEKVPVKPARKITKRKVVLKQISTDE